MSHKISQRRTVDLMAHVSIQICFLFTMLDNPQISEDTAKLLWTSQKWLLVSLLAARCGDQPSGGARRDRTDDLMLAKHALSQLSYGPKANAKHSPTARQPIRKANERKRQSQAARRQRHIMVGLGGLEPPTSRLSSARSNQLSYKPEPWTRELCSQGPVTGLVREERETKTAVSRSIGLTGRVVPSVPIEEQALLEEHP